MSGEELEGLEFLCDFSETVDPQFLKIIFEGYKLARNQPDAIIEAIITFTKGLDKYPSLLKYLGDSMGVFKQAISEGKIDVLASAENMKIGLLFKRFLMIANKMLAKEELKENN